MRRVSLILAVLLFAVPSWATVTITCEQIDDTNECVVSYAVDYPGGEPNKIRALALDITVDSGAIITDVNDDKNAYYTIYPGSVVISDGEITDEGEAVADPCDYPEDTQPGLDSSGITVEMGALWSYPDDDDGNAPPISGILLTFFVDGEVDCNVVITENQIRGGVVLTDPEEAIAYVSPGCRMEFEPPDCLIGGNADFPPGSGSEYADWSNPLWNKPACWCYCRQCRGDADGLKTGPFWVAIPDLTILYAAYSKVDAILATIPNGICADFDHKKTGPFRVAIPDLSIAYNYYSQIMVPPCDQAPVITGPYNFWCDPAGCPAVCPPM